MTPNGSNALWVVGRCLRVPTHDGDEIDESTENELVRFLLIEVKVTKQELLHEIPINHAFMVVHHFLHGALEVLVGAGRARQ